MARTYDEQTLAEREARREERRARRSSYDDVGPMQRRVAASGFDTTIATRIVLAIAAIAFVLVAGKLVKLQVFDSATLTARAQARTNTVPISAKRGMILDRNGNVMAMSVDCQTVYCNPREIEDIDGTARIISEVLGGDMQDYADIIKQDTTFAYVKKKVDTSLCDQLQQALAAYEYPGIHYLADTKRVYPYGRVGAQIIGMVDNEGHGLTGLEYYYDSILSGTDGSLLMEAGADGTPIAGGANQEIMAKDGVAIVLSIDVDIQRAAEDAVEKGMENSYAESGAAVVTNPDTGEIYAACSTPFFDPDDLANATNESLLLKPVVSSYELGSVYKALTVAIGVDAGLVTGDSTFYVPVQVKVGDDYVKDDDDRYYDLVMDVNEIIRRSSNTGAVLVGETIGAEKIYNGFRAFGIGQRTGVDYPGEADGIVASWENWTGATLGATSFGQGFAVPPMQLVRAIGAIANGGTLMTPHFLMAREDTGDVEYEKGAQAVRTATCEQMVGILHAPLEEGGTATEAVVPGYDIVGKTGTGEIADTEYGGYKYGVYNSSFIGFNAEGETTILAYLGLYETPYLASASACPVWAELMEESLHRMGVAPTQGADTADDAAISGVQL